jgi:hypothetical protein
MKDHLRVWIPRVVGIGAALFIGMFALDAFTDRGFWRSLPGFFMHLMPSLMLLAIVFLAWRLPLVGAIAFALLAVAYAAMARRIDWILVIGGPLLLAGVLYFATWMRFRARPLP